jgi:WD40 repeat protein
MLETVMGTRFHRLVVATLSCLASPFLASGQDGPRKNESITIQAHERTIRGVAFAKGGESFWTIGEDGAIKEWSRAGRKLIRQLGEAANVGASVAVSPDGRVVATGASGAGLCLWDSDSAKVRLTIATEFTPQHIGFSASGRHLAAALFLADHAAVWDAATGNKLATLKEPAYPAPTDEPTNGRSMGAIAYSSDGRFLAACNAPPRYMTVISLYDADAFTLLARFIAHERDRGYCLAFSPDGKVLACGTQDAQVKVFDVDGIIAAWQERAKATASRDAELPTAVAKLVSLLASDDFQRREAAFRELSGLGPAALASLKKHFADASDAETRVRLQTIVEQLTEQAEGALKGLMPVHTLNVPRIDSVRALAFAPDGMRLAVGSMKLNTTSGQLEIWRLDQPQEPEQMIGDQPVNCLAFSPDGKLVASGLTGGMLLLTESR